VVEGIYSFFLTRVQNFLCMFVILAIPYMLTGFVGCLVGREISRGARKLARTST
jgi:hypothetical protein